MLDREIGRIGMLERGLAGLAGRAWLAWPAWLAWLAVACLASAQGAGPATMAAHSQEAPAQRQTSSEAALDPQSNSARPAQARTQAQAQTQTQAQARAKDEAADSEHVEPTPAVGIRFEGRLPGSNTTELEGRFSILFRIYKSPQGGEAIWSETREVEVTRGRMDLLLGEQQPIPMAIQSATFKFLGASVNGQREVYPRYAIVNVVFVSPEQALLAPTEPAEPQAELGAGAADGAAAKPAAAARPRSWRVARETLAAASWERALLAARAAGADLPTHLEWYAALRDASPSELEQRSGHYEWVLPWVYDPASHGRFSRYFRGRFEGCDYMDLSPENAYPYRLATPARPTEGQH